MSHGWKIFWAVCLCVGVSGAGAQTGLDTDDGAPAETENAGDQTPAAPPSYQDELAVEAAVIEKLQTKVTTKVKSAPLDAVIDLLAAQGKFNAVIDSLALEQEGFLPDSPISLELKDVSIETVLEQISESSDFGSAIGWYVENGVVIVTTDQAMEEVFFTRMYPVGHLLGSDKPAKEDDGADNETNAGVFAAQSTQFVQFGGNVNNPDGGLGGGGLGGGTGGFFGGVELEPTPESRLVNAIQTVLPGPWMDIDGIGGQLAIHDDVLLVRHTWHGQRMVAQFLDALAQFVDPDSDKMVLPIRRPNYPFDADEKVRSALEKRIKVDFRQKPLVDAVNEIGRMIDADIRLNEQALLEEGIDPDDVRLNLRLTDVPARVVFKLLLRAHGVTTRIENGSVVVTTETEHEENGFVIKVYDVRDLIGQEDDEAGELTDRLTMVSGGTWLDIDGIGGSIAAAVPGVLAVKGHPSQQELISQAIAELRKHKPKEEASRPKRKDPNEMVMKFYPLFDRETADDALDAIPQFVDADNWDAEGIIVHRIGVTLVIKQTRSVHEKVKKFIYELYSTHGVGGFGNEGDGLNGGFGGGGGFFNVR